MITNSTIREYVEKQLNQAYMNERNGKYKIAYNLYKSAHTIAKDYDDYGIMERAQDGMNRCAEYLTDVEQDELSM